MLKREVQWLPKVPLYPVSNSSASQWKCKGREGETGLGQREVSVISVSSKLVSSWGRYAVFIYHNIKKMMVHLFSPLFWSQLQPQPTWHICTSHERTTEDLISFQELFQQINGIRPI